MVKNNVSCLAIEQSRLGTLISNLCLFSAKLSTHGIMVDNGKPKKYRSLVTYLVIFNFQTVILK